MKDYSELAQDDLNRAEEWANRDSADPVTREHFVSYLMQRAGIYSLLSIAQEINKLPANMPEYVINYHTDD